MKAFAPELVESSQGPLVLWDEPLDGRRYVVGADIAEGKFRDAAAAQRVDLYSKDRPDYTAAVVLDAETTNHVATWHGYAAPMETATYLAALALYYNTALLAVEMNGPGESVLDFLRTVVMYPNLFRSRLTTKVDLEGERLPGWLTTSATRHMIVGNMERAYKDDVLFTRDERVVREMQRMQNDKTGKPRAIGRDKDDLVFAFGIALQAVFEGSHNTVAPVKEEPRHRDSWVWDHLKTVREAASRYPAHPTLHGRYPPRGPRAPRFRGSGGRLAGRGP